MYRIRLLILSGMVLLGFSVFSGKEQVMASPAAVLPASCSEVSAQLSASEPVPDGRKKVFQLQCQAEWEVDIRAEWYEEMNHLESMAGIVYDPI